MGTPQELVREAPNNFSYALNFHKANSKSDLWGLEIWYSLWGPFSSIFALTLYFKTNWFIFWCHGNLILIYGFIGNIFLLDNREKLINNELFLLMLIDDYSWPRKTESYISNGKMTIKLSSLSKNKEKKGFIYIFLFWFNKLIKIPLHCIQKCIKNY